CKLNSEKSVPRRFVPSAGFAVVSMPRVYQLPVHRLAGKFLAPPQSVFAPHPLHPPEFSDWQQPRPIPSMLLRTRKANHSAALVARPRWHCAEYGPEKERHVARLSSDRKSTRLNSSHVKSSYAGF